MSIVAKKIMMGSGAVALPSDDEFNRVSFLSHFDGANNGVNNAFDDGSASNHTVTAAGNVTQGSFGPFARPDGEWGVSFDGATSSLSLTNDSDISLNGDFCIEGFINFNATDLEGNKWRTVFFNGASGGTQIAIENSNSQFIFYHGSTLLTTSSAPALNTWHHFAISRTGSGTNNLSLYFNGSRVSQTSSTVTFGASSGTSKIGAFTDTTGVWAGSISNFRIVKGSAVYSGSSITVPTSKLTAITNTKLLTCQSNRFVDNSASAHTITPAGNVAVTAFGPILTSSVYDPAVNGASAFFDGTGDQISVADSSDFDVGAGLFTAEAWVYPTNPASQAIIIGQWTGSHAWALMLSSDGNRTLRYIIKSGGTFYDKIADNTGLPLNAFSHVAFSRAAGNVFAIYVNGARVRTDTLNITANNSTGVLGVGGNSGSYWGGYISDARMVKGTAVYAGASYTVPTAPLAAITNTKLLLNMADGQAIDSAAQNNLTLVGTAKTSTAQKKFGTASMVLDGNSDYAYFSENGGNDIDNAGNWTVEFFWRFNNKTSPQYQMILTKYGLQIYTNNGELSLAIADASGYFINKTGGTVLDNDTWYHICVVKNGTAYNEYLNGTNEANLAATSSTIIDTGGRPWYIGTLQNSEGTYPANGYIDEVRISRFARYTSNFTAPSEPFLDKGQ